MTLENGGAVVSTATRNAGGWLGGSLLAPFFDRNLAIMALTVRTARDRLRQRRSCRPLPARGASVTDGLIRITTALAVGPVAAVAAVISTDMHTSWSVERGEDFLSVPSRRTTPSTCLSGYKVRTVLDQRFQTQATVWQ